jgi:hypothetical protein
VFVLVAVAEVTMFSKPAVGGICSCDYLYLLFRDVSDVMSFDFLFFGGVKMCPCNIGNETCNVNKHIVVMLF